MGLLDQILGGVVGGALGGRRSPMGGGIGAGTGLGGIGGKGQLMVLLLPLVLQMLRNRPQAGGAQAAPGEGGLGGGLGGLGSILTGGGGGGGLGGGLGGAGGGLGGLLEQLTGRGFGRQAQSWVSTGDNEPLPPEALDGLFEPQQLQALASQAGVSEDDVRGGMAELLPEVVNHLTPGGQLPGQDELLAGIDTFEQQLPPR